MSKFNTKQILSAIAFLALAGFSCYWTAESLFIWQPSITRIGSWLIAVVFYVVASICFSRFIKSFDRRAVFDEGLFKSRGGHLIFGLLGLLIFWLMFSLPTNTHTLIYRSSICNVITTDLVRTDGYLKTLKYNNAAINDINKRYNDIEDSVKSIFSDMKIEIIDNGNEGIGVKFDRLVLRLENVLGTSIQRAKNPGKNVAEWQRTIADYRKKTDDKMVIIRNRADNDIVKIRQLMNSKLLNGLIYRDSIALTNIDEMSGVDNNVIEETIGFLRKDYSFIKDNSQYISFKNDEEKELYTRDRVKPETDAMLSVPDVWRDYLTTDKYRGYGFFWWVLLAFLVDLAAFIFFDEAFK